MRVQFFRGVLPLLASLPLAILFASGCEGPQGPAGEGVSDLDLVPPTIQLTRPRSSDTLFVDTFTVAAEASDNEGVGYVEFFLDGSSDLGGTVAVDSSAPYSLLWDMAASGHGLGPHLLVARAYDLTRNHTDTPPIFLFRKELKGIDILYYDGYGAVDALPLPDTFGDRYFNVRFTPAGPCTLREIWFEFLEPGQNDPPLSGGVDIYVLAWSSENNLPAAALDSLLVPEGDIPFNLWLQVDVSDWNLQFSGDFHAGWTPDDSRYGEYLAANRGIGMLYNLNPEPLLNPREHRSGELEAGEGGRGWGTILEQWEQQFDFHIRAVVEYGDGSTALLAPGSPAPPPPERSGASAVRLYGEKVPSGGLK